MCWPVRAADGLGSDKGAMAVGSAVRVNKPQQLVGVALH